MHRPDYYGAVPWWRDDSMQGNLVSLKVFQTGLNDGGTMLRIGGQNHVYTVQCQSSTPRFGHGIDLYGDNVTISGYMEGRARTAPNGQASAGLIVRAGAERANIDLTVRSCQQNVLFEDPGLGSRFDIASVDPIGDHMNGLAALAPVFSVQTAAQKLLAQLLYWTEPGQDRLPAGDSGYKAQYEINAVAAIAIAKLIPTIWNDPALTADRKTRLDLAMQGCLAGSAWCMSDANLWMGSFATERTIMGFQSGQNANPNFSSPPKEIIQIASEYLGRSAAAAFLATFDRAAFSAACTAAGGLGKMALVFSRDWTPSQVDTVYGKSSGARTGPTRLQLETAVRNYSCKIRGVTTADAAVVFAEQLEYNFQKLIRPGVIGRNGSPYGIIGAYTQNQLRAVLVTEAAWAGLPNAGLVGAPFELDTVNGGYQPDLRSSMSYVARGVGAVFAGMCAPAAQGLHVGREAQLAEGTARVQRGSPTCAT